MKKYPRVKELLDQYATEYGHYLLGLKEQRENDLIEEIRKAIQKLRSLDSPISQTAIIKVLHISKPRLKACPLVKEILEQARKQYRFQKEVVILVQMKAAIVSLHNSGKPMTQRAIARSLGTYRSPLSFYPRVREIMVRIKEYGKN